MATPQLPAKSFLPPLSTLRPHTILAFIIITVEDYHSGHQYYRASAYITTTIKRLCKQLAQDACCDFFRAAFGATIMYEQKILRRLL
jgi:hypothetical protein